MFYSAQILARKGPLGIVWIAAHHDKNYLKKQQVSGTNILDSCDRIISPEAPLALRLSGQLMLGVVRIYYKQVEYLANDANGALIKLRQMGKPADVDLPPESMAAAPDQINLPDKMYDDIFQSSSGINFDAFGETPTGTPRAVTPRGRRSSIAFVEEEHSQMGSGLFGHDSQHFGEPETFETFDDAFLDAEFRAEEPELARAAPADGAAGPDGNALGLGLDHTPGALPLPDDDGEVPMPDLPEPEFLEPVATPGSGPPPASPLAAGASPDGAPFRLPSIEPLADGEPGSAARVDTDASKRSPARQKRPKSSRRAPVLDVKPDGAPNTKLPSSVISALLRDRASLMTDRGPQVKRLKSSAPLPPDHVAMQSDAAAQSRMYWPAHSATMAPPLYDLIRAALGSAATGMPPPPPRLPARPPQTPPAGGEGIDADGIEATPAGAPDGGAGFDADSELPMPDAMDYQPDELAPDAPHTGPEARDGSVPPSAKRARLSLSGVPRPSASGSVLGGGDESDMDASNAGRVRKEVDSWLAGKFAAVRVKEAVLAPQQGVLKGRDRLFAARAFFETLQLQKDKKVRLAQAAPFGDIAVTPARNWDRRNSVQLSQSQSTGLDGSESQLL